MADSERRRAVRVVRPMEVQYASDCPPISARIEAISGSGAFVDTNQPLEVGRWVQFRFFLPDETPDVPLRAGGEWPGRSP